MALDGAFLRHVKNEIECCALGSKVDKIYQPNKEEFIFYLRNKDNVYKLFMSSRANSARINFTKYPPENPAVPPMLCMLFRKKLLGAKLVKIRQPDLERVLFLDFESKNELGDLALVSVVVEIMGRYSNIILIDENGKIIDALKRIDALTSSKRQVLPGGKYKFPPTQRKLSLLSENIEKIVEKISLQASQSEKSTSDIILSVVKGLSPIVCDEIVFRSQVYKKHGLVKILTFFKEVVNECSGTPSIVYVNDIPKDFSFFEPTQYKNKFAVKKCDNFSQLLDEFFLKRDTADRIRTKTYNLRHRINNVISRLKKKIKIQAVELEENKNKKKLKLLADLVSANIYKIRSGAAEVTLENFYDENFSKIKIKLDPRLTPAENVEKLYREYKKSKVAIEKLKEEINKAKQEIFYIETVLDEINRVSVEDELDEIKNELFSQGYIKRKTNNVKSKKNKFLAPIEYHLREDIRVLVGRNNYQNDRLTLKTAPKNSLWFHVKDMPGAHTILIADKKNIDDDILIKSAKIAAYHSKAQNSANVPVDFTLVKNVKKPSGAKPGMVIYNDYKTIYITPSENFIEKLKNNGELSEKNFKNLF